MAKASQILGDLKVATDDQLSTQLGELKREQFNLRFQAATNQLEKPSRVKEVRRTIAQIKTLQTERTRSTARSSVARRSIMPMTRATRSRKGRPSASRNARRSPS